MICTFNGVNLTKQQNFIKKEPDFTGNKRNFKQEKALKTPDLQTLKAYNLSFKGLSSLEKNISLAKEAVEYVKNLKLQSNTRMELDNPSIIGSGNEIHRNICQKRILLDKKRQGKSIDEFIQITKEEAPKLGVGNCAEQAILAADYLKEQKGVKNFALVAVENIDPFKTPGNLDDHVIVLTGLDKEAELNNPASWGMNTVIVDPWGDINSPVRDFKDYKNSGIVKLQDLFGTQSLKFSNYADFIDPAKDSLSKYNWENHKGEY